MSEQNRTVAEKLIIGCRLCCYVAGLLFLLALIDLALCVTATVDRVGRRADTLINSAANVAVRLDDQLDDEFIRNAKNYLYTSIDASQITINTSTRLVDRAVVFLDNLDKRSGKTADKIDLTIDKLNEQTFPAINGLLTDTDHAVGQTGLLLAELRERLKDPEMARLLSNLATAAGQTGETLESLRATNDEIRAALPELLKTLNKLAENSASVTGEAATLLKSINAPTSRKMKIWRAIIQAVAVAAPVAIRR